VVFNSRKKSVSGRGVGREGFLSQYGGTIHLMNLAIYTQYVVRLLHTVLH